MTPHNEAKKGEIAKIVIMPGDPMRAKYIAEHYLDDYKLVNQVRGMYAYTGKYKGKEITVMGHGMGMAGAGIYFYELFKIYDVDKIIRIGSCGTYKEDINLLDLVICDKVYTESNYAFEFSKNDIHIAYPNKKLFDNLVKIAQDKNIKYRVGTALCSDVFDKYVDSKAIYDRMNEKMEILAVEMESFALLHIANSLNKEAACILTVVDSACREEIVSTEDRETGLKNMIEIALDSILL